jgi:hypothetical protein
MTSNIRNFISEDTDLTVSLALRRYMDMAERDAYSAIIDEWPQQMAVILIMFIAAVSNPATKHIYKFVHRARKNGKNSYVDMQTERRGQL